jgi:hypothetical protein
MSNESPRYPFRVRWWENDTSYAATKGKSGWDFYEKEAESIRWSKISSTPRLIARAEASLAEGKYIQELPAAESQPPIHEVQFYSCFISYSSKDQPFAARLHADLQNKGVRCWFAPHNIQGGKKIHEQIDDAIRLYDRLLLILSEHSIESEWVLTEVANARKRERRESRRMLFPVRLVDFERLHDWVSFDADTGKDFAREIREYYVPDFSNWKDHDSYQREFDRLLRDLKAEEQFASPAT